MKCRTCKFEHEPHQLWLGQCIQCVGKERDEFEEQLYKIMLNTGYADPDYTIPRFKQQALNRTHP